MLYSGSFTPWRPMSTAVTKKKETKNQNVLERDIRERRKRRKIDYGKLGSGPSGQDLGLEARIWALRLGFGPRDWDLGLKTGNWASRLGFEGGGRRKRKRRRRKNFPYV